MREKHLLSTFITILVLWMVAANSGFSEDPLLDYPEVTRIEFLPTGGWNVVGTIRVPLELVDGFNSFEFFNKNDPAPDFDKIIIIPDSELIYQSEAEKNVIVGNAIIIQRSNMSTGEGVGYLGRGVENYLVYNVYVEQGSGGFYEMAIDYANGDGISRIAYMVTNKPPICPRWALEPWVWEDNINTQAAIENVVQGYLDRNIPGSAVIIDSPWETCYNDFEWWDVKYPNPQQMIDGFHADGIKVIMWISGFVNNDTWEDNIPLKKCEDYDAVESLSVNSGDNFNWWKGRGRHIDFTDPDALEWLHVKIRL